MDGAADHDSLKNQNVMAFAVRFLAAKTGNVGVSKHVVLVSVYTRGVYWSHYMYVVCQESTWVKGMGKLRDFLEWHCFSILHACKSQNDTLDTLNKPQIHEVIY